MEHRSFRPGTAHWWLAGGDEECPHCEARYAYEAEVRCAGCDSPMCPLCAAWSARRPRCPECAPRGTA